MAEDRIGSDSPERNLGKNAIIAGVLILVTMAVVAIMAKFDVGYSSENAWVAYITLPVFAAIFIGFGCYILHGESR